MYAGMDFASRTLAANGWERSPAREGLAGFASGLPEAAVTTPFQVIKVRMQQRGPGGSVLYRNDFECLLQVCRQEGLMVLTKGFPATVARNCVWNSVYFGTIAALDTHDKVEGMAGELQRFGQGLAAGVFATCFNAPLDVAKSRIQSAGGQYTSTAGTLLSIVREEGPLALYRGFAPKACRMGMGGAVGYATYDFVLRLLSRRRAVAMMQLVCRVFKHSSPCAAELLLLFRLAARHSWAVLELASCSDIVQVLVLASLPHVGSGHSCTVSSAILEDLACEQTDADSVHLIQKSRAAAVQASHAARHLQMPSPSATPGPREVLNGSHSGALLQDGPQEASSNGGILPAVPAGSDIWNETSGWMRVSAWHPAGVVSNLGPLHVVEWREVSYVNLTVLVCLCAVAYPAISISALIGLTVLVSMCLSVGPQAKGEASEESDSCRQLPPGTAYDR
ncbi:unnamed protein product, partial [Polarella glacialis]